MSGSITQAELDSLHDLFDRGRLADVIERGEILLGRYPQSFLLNQMLGAASGMLGQNERAAEFLREALRLKPDFVFGHINLGVALESLGRRREAVASYRDALRLQPDCAEAHYSLGAALHALGSLDEAAAAYEDALRFMPDHAEAHYNLATVLQDLDRRDGSGDRHAARAMACYRRALEIRPDLVQAHVNLGLWLQNLGRTDDALAHYRRALEISPDFADAIVNLGLLLHKLGRVDEAMACQRRALTIRPDDPEPCRNLGVMAQEQGRIPEAIAWFDQALRLKPAHVEARCLKLYLAAQICDWDVLRSDARLVPALGVEGEAAPPFAMLYFDDDPERNRRRAEVFAAGEYGKVSPPSGAVGAAAAPRSPGPIRIGYFSADFHEHAVMHFMARLFELHDRNRFSVHLFSYGPPSDSEMRRRLKAAADVFHDVGSRTDRDIAAFAREQRVDLAVDLMGYTYANRLGIFASRAAPVQISYLGFPGTLASGFIDYIVADRIVIPDDKRQHYSENILYLPHCYQVNDDRRPISGRQMTREEMGLPDTFVFSCFNNPAKISPELFDIWMRLLHQVEGSVLWLYRSNAWVEENLRREAERRGVAPDRLIFASLLPMPDHLARHALADLSLDTFDYNGHATASHALWAGLPLITRTGNGFAARVSSSLLSALLLPELITETAEEYERLALDLARDPERLSGIRAKLAANRLTTPLFDAAQSARHMESAYEQAWQTWLEGRPPADISVDP